VWVVGEGSLDIENWARQPFAVSGAAWISLAGAMDIKQCLENFVHLGRRQSPALDVKTLIAKMFLSCRH
jgi:hypothetical protein